MDVKFITVRKSNLNAVPVVDGQVVALEDSNGMFYDMNSNRYKISAVKVAERLEGTGFDGELFVATSGENAGVYFWNNSNKSWVLVANKDTDTYLTIVKNALLEKVYLVGFDGTEDSKEILWNDNVYMNFVDGTVTAKEFLGKASDSYKADEANHAKSSDTSKQADVASKIGTSTVGDAFTAVYILNGVPTVCSHSVKKDVPEDAVFTDTTYKVFEGATSESNGLEGLVPAPLTSDTQKFLKGDGTWSDVEIPDMVGCTSTKDGTRGLVPYPAKGKYNSFLKGDGTWASYSAGYGLELVSLTFNLEDSGVTPGSYGPLPNAEDMTKYIGDYIPVPRITVDKYGRVTDIREVLCYAGGGGPTPTPDASLMQFSFTPDNERLLCTYDNLETAVAEMSVKNGHLMADYKYDPSPYTLEIDEDGHVLATSTTETTSTQTTDVTEETNNG